MNLKQLRELFTINTFSDVKRLMYVDDNLEEFMCTKIWTDPIELNHRSKIPPLCFTTMKFNNCKKFVNIRYLQTLYLENCSFSFDCLKVCPDLKTLSIENCVLLDNIVPENLPIENLRIKSTSIDQEIISQFKSLKKISIDQNDDEDWRIEWIVNPFG